MKAFDYCNVGHFFPMENICYVWKLDLPLAKYPKGRRLKGLKFKSCLPLDICSFIWGYQVENAKTAFNLKHNI